MRATLRRRRASAADGGRDGEATSLLAVSIVLIMVLSLMLVSGMVIHRSYAAFTDATASSGNTFSTGTVDLVDDDSGQVLFNASGLIPGQSVTSCVVVTYQGSIADPGPVRVYSGGFTDSGSLASHLDLTIEEGTGGDFGDCSGFSPSGTLVAGVTLAAFHSARTSWTTGVGTWDPSGTPSSTTYRITVTLASSAPNGLQGAEVSGQSFVWEVQS